MSWLVNKGGYLFDRRLFITVLVAIILLGVVTAHREGWSLQGHPVIRCPDTAYGPYCINPMLEACKLREPFAVKHCGEYCEDPRPLCQQERIPRGDYVGREPNPLTKNFGFFTVVAILLAFAVNHLAYNRRWRPSKQQLEP